MNRVKSMESVPLPESLRQRELEIAGEIARAFLAANRSLEVYRLALARVTPLVGASFSSVFLRDTEDESLLKLVCAQNWPQASARFLGQMRIRVGRGPTGRAVEHGQAFDVEDVFAEPGLREWWEPARELGFTSLISLPLKRDGEVTGALTFYFEAARRFEAPERTLLTMVTDQLAGTADRAQQLERLQTANERLERENAELRRRLGEAEEARRLASRFLLNVSHELGAPLTAIRGHADLLAGDPGGRLSLQQHAMVERIGQAAAMLLRLTGNLLDLSRLRLGQTGLEEAPQEAGALAERALAAAGPVPEAVRFRLERPDGAVPLVADGDKIVTILDNLLSNAFHFTARGEVVLTVRRTPLIVPAEGRHAVVEWEVRDSGIGIRDEELTSIFDELRQVDGSSTRLYGGTGLGLSLSRGLARLLGGEITVQSQQSSGSTFTFRLPARVS
jgi:signal transduction histidine kinase